MPRHRVPGGLEATLTLDKKYCAFPGIINGGIISAIFDCHGNWTAAIALMDKACLPKPPLTLTFEMLVRDVHAGVGQGVEACVVRSLEKGMMAVHLAVCGVLEPTPSDESMIFRAFD